jgi:hypothetical protein
MGLFQLASSVDSFERLFLDGFIPPFVNDDDAVGHLEIQGLPTALH